VPGTGGLNPAIVGRDRRIPGFSYKSHRYRLARLVFRLFSPCRGLFRTWTFAIDATALPPSSVELGVAAFKMVTHLWRACL